MPLIAQEDSKSTVYDSIPIIYKNGTYRLGSPILYRVHLQEPKPKKIRSNGTGSEILNNLGDFAINYWTDWSVSTSKSKLHEFVFKSKIDEKQNWIRWDVELLTRGYFHKEKSRITDSGYTEKTTIKSYEILWEDDAIGLISQDKIPFGNFVLSTYLSDTLANNFYHAFDPEIETGDHPGKRIFLLIFLRLIR
jgi:hypothetical protein